VMESSPGTLYVVPTPVGNLDDMTYRAVETLRRVNVAACEDTRTSGVLFNRYDIETDRTSFHQHNEYRKTPALVQRLLRGESVAIVSDAGTPGISDPGYLLVRAAVEADIPVVALPGATAFVPAIAASGLPSDRFIFEGFLPPKKGRVTRLAQLASDERTVVLYESPHRISKLMTQALDAFGPERPAVIAREISKKFEEYLRGSVAELARRVEEHPPKGEMVVIIGGSRMHGRTFGPERDEPES